MWICIRVFGHAHDRMPRTAIEKGDLESNRFALLALANLAAAAGPPRDAVVGAGGILVAVRYTCA